MDETMREKIALFRYGAISEVVNGPLAPGEKEKLLARLAAKEWIIPGTSRMTIGRSTLREWANHYDAMGLDGLMPQARADKGSSRAIPEPVQDLLLALRRERPKANVQSLIRAARLSGKVDARVQLAPSTVYRLLAAHGLPAAQAGQAEPDARAFTYPHTGDLWTSDVMHGPRLLVPGHHNGRKTYLIALLDDATRMVTFSAFYPSENAACFTEALKQGLLRRGVPRRLYVDNGSAYRTQHLQVVCATLNVALVHSRPYMPRGRGKIERFFRTVRSTFLPHLTTEHLSSIASLNRAWWAWIEAEYHHTPHRGLDGATPLDRFLADQALVRPAPEDLDRLMRMKARRKVARDRTIRLDGRLYEAPDGFVGETVTVLYDPYDPARPVHLMRDDQRDEIPLRRLDATINATLPRARRDDAEGQEPIVATGISYLDLIARGFYGDEGGEG
ncbi:MAG: DDE-type integrase/transposase/recombinase [Armatimonadetes bacterium]|nr:DDE-type integrase/transposase/recombinase [Armatimonadota bacterium]